jgi:AraC-type DNA-binding domain-containing proteins
MKEQIEAVLRMQYYIDEHLSTKITLGDLARASFFSPWYSHRLFYAMLGITPAEYIRKLRLSKAVLKLRDESSKIIDIAFEFGYGSVDGFQRAFANEFGCNPKEYALCPTPLYLFTPYKIECNNERREIMLETKSVFIQVVEKPQRKVIIKRSVNATDYFAYCEEVGCDVWGLLTSIESISGEPVCLWLPKKHQKEGTSEYVQGVEVAMDYAGVIPDGFDVIELPSAKYLMFQGEPFAEEEYCLAIEEVQSAISKYTPSNIGYSWDKENPRIQLEPIGTRGYIELISIK